MATYSKSTEILLGKNCELLKHDFTDFMPFWCQAISIKGLYLYFTCHVLFIVLCTCRSSAPLLHPHLQTVQPCRTRVIYGLRDGEPESVQDVIDRFYRLENGLWIRPHAGRAKKLWTKSHRRIKRLRQHVFCNATQCRMLDKMVNIEYKTPKYYVGDPYTPYHRKSNLPDYRYRPPKFLPWVAWLVSASLVALTFVTRSSETCDYYSFTVSTKGSFMSCSID